MNERRANRRRRPSPASRTTRRGFSLVEAIVALLIVGVAIPPMLWAMSAAQSRRADAALAATAGWLATEKLEDIIADRHSTTRGYNYVASTIYAPEAAVSGFGRFSRSVSISETAANLSSSGTGYKTVTVSVGYSDSRNQARSLQLKAVVTSYTP